MYAGLQTTAARMITKFGIARTLVRPTGTTYDPITGLPVTPAPVPTQSSVQAVFVGITQAWTDKFAIQAGDAVALVAADGTEPKQNDTMDGWTVVAVEPVKPGATTLIYRCHLRKQ